MTINKNLEAALSYARRGWHVYPARGKASALVKWGTKATTDEKIIRGWWRTWPDAIVCIACGPSGLAVIDLDVKDGKNGPAVLDALERRHGRLPPTMMQRTGSGGTHLIFRGEIKTTVGVLGEGIDTRGRGGMIVAAPSIIGGGAYQLLVDELTGEVPDPAELPVWAAELAGRVLEVEKGDGEFEPLYTDEEFERLLNLIPVQKFDEDHDAWLALMLACSHASTVEDGEDAFMRWTTKDGPGNRIGYSSDFDLILARWRYNYAKRNMKGGRQVGSFNRAVLAAAPGAKVKVPPQPTAEDDFGADPYVLSPAEEAAQRRYDRVYKKRRDAFRRDTTVQPLLKARN
jgi:hypothetical protein